jgi:hypothetical protein
MENGSQRIDPRTQIDGIQSVKGQIDALPWPDLQQSLAQSGYAVTSAVLTSGECADLRGLYGQNKLFRSHVIMERLQFGRGDYKYFANPLPPIVHQLRTHAYPHLAAVANRWAEQLEDDTRFPTEHAEFLDYCHRRGQSRPTPLMLHYEQSGYNCLHQDIYGAVAFPIQMVFMLGQQGRDWQGGEFVLLEQRPRAQSKVEVISADEGCAVAFTTRYRPVQGSRGYYRVTMRHGVAPVRSGSRYTLGIIFHDAE